MEKNKIDNISTESLLPDESKIGNIDSFLEEDPLLEHEKNITIQGENSYYKESFYTTDIYDENEFTKFIKAIERIVRRSNEYKAYIGFLKNDLELDSCSFLNQVNHDKAEIEFHHYPFTLYDICCIVVEDRLAKKKPVSSFIVAKEVMDLHFKHLIGVVPLSKTVHELAHAGEIFINLKQVFGDFEEFIDLYKDTMNQFMIDDYNKLVEMSKNNLNYSEKDILQKK